MKIRRTHHEKAEQYVADAESLKAAARDSLDFALAHNELAIQHHTAMVEHHDGQLIAAHQQADRVAKARTALR